MLDCIISSISFKMSKRSHVFSVEGNIGAGKSQFINFAKQCLPDCTFVPEPLDEWRNVPSPDGKFINVFQLFGQDNAKYKFPFQLMTLTSHLSWHNKIQHKTKFSMLERSYLSGANVFTLSQRNNKLISECEWAIYNHILNTLLPKECNINGIIYLRTSPEKCLERLRLRNRDEENSVDLEYLKTLHEYHENWLNGLKNVLIIDNDTSRESLNDYASQMKDVQSFMQQCAESS